MECRRNRERKTETGSDVDREKKDTGTERLTRHRLEEMELETEREKKDTGQIE